ncbi:hypothetical protein DC522_06520 [Microvirga sp. KLBC 81]|uniref:hypothetical protein n=1 Tax=Microvirga sp. KLBC 81 TaxID=1862707 RepID=UPI000D50F9A0|nr:hypothetical protein [Microvirga sp. KLBC 81]PVE25184.1 hypothetical protein DC522_06520 [Microvirga sp. KLBC 81]
MFRPLLALAFIVTGIGTARAECSVATQKRWENAMSEIMQIERLRVRMTLEEETTNIRFQCRVKDVLVEISAAAKEYFPACDPHVADNAHVAVLKTENALSKFDASKCSKTQAASTKKK